MPRTIECPRCDRMFSDEHGLKQHLADAVQVVIDYIAELEEYKAMYEGLCK